jgi:hypothetical protein
MAIDDDDDKLDLSALDPTRDELRFARLVRSVGSRAAQARGPADAGALLVRWWLPTLALAASVALAAWAPSLVSDLTPSQSSDPAATLLQWARGTRSPTPSEVLASLGSKP